MSTIEMLVCDNCGRTADRDVVVAWIHVERPGRDFSTLSDPKLPADLCGKDCTRVHLQLEKVKDGT